MSENVSALNDENSANQLDLGMRDQSADSSLCDDPDKCPRAMCGCRWLQTGDAWTNESEKTHDN